MAAGELSLFRAVHLNDPDGAISLKRVVVERGFIIESMLPAAPRDVLAIFISDRVSVVGREIRQPAHVRAIRFYRVNIEVAVLRTGGQNTSAIRRLGLEIVGTARERSHGVIR